MQISIGFRTRFIGICIGLGLSVGQCEQTINFLDIQTYLPFKWSCFNVLWHCMALMTGES